MDSKQTLSEISHLFLSEIRQRPGAPGARPSRVPPAPAIKPAATKAHASVDLTPEEMAAACGEDAAAKGAGPEISILLASHLSDAPRRIRAYARHVAAKLGRVGLIEIDGNELAITGFEPESADSVQTESAAPFVDELDGRRMSETLAEMSFDVDRWLISVGNPRTAEARELLRASSQWILLTTADHEGVVAAYRALKGLSDLGKPKISAAVLDSRDDAEADAVFHKLDAVAGQFLGCRIAAQSPVRTMAERAGILEHPILHCRASQDKQQGGTAPQWHVLADFLSRAGVTAKRPESPMPTMKIEPAVVAAAAPAVPVARKVIPMPVPGPSEEVIDLPDDAEESVLEAIVNRGGAAGEWVQCPIRPPGCPQAILAVGRDHRLVLVAVAGKGLSQLRPIGLALRWMNENCELIRMALPQLAIDAQGIPSVRLLVDYSDLSAEQMQPLLHSEAVSVQAYRKIKWGSRRGILLEAA
jgi:hypothetical protein